MQGSSFTKDPKILLRKLTVTAVCTAFAVVLKCFTNLALNIPGLGIKIGLGGIFNFFPAALCGPLWGGAASALTDLIGHFLAPDGAYIPWLTLTAFAGGCTIGFLWRAASRRASRPLRIALLSIFSVILFFGVATGTALMRDGVTGVGTLTYYDPATGRYGALGHGIADETSGALMPLRDGSVLSAVVADVRPGGHGTAGELVGSFDADDRIGAIERNGLFGIFGTLDAPPDGTPVETAPASAVRTGSATILSTVAGDTVQAYAVNITRVYHDGASTRFAITVTDPALLAATGGIVQGMSGSPILQDGRLIGAVTHVLLADPAKGYGVSIDDMLAAAQAQAA